MNTAAPSLCSKGVRLRALALGCAVSALMVSTAGVAGAPDLTVGEPAGFEDLSAPQTMLVDVYFGGVRRGEITVSATPDSVKINNAAQLLAILPEVADRAVVEAALAQAALPANPDRVCTAAADRSTCGRLAPESVGVILDRNTLRLDVFLNPRLLSVHDNIEEQYLPAAVSRVSMINAIGAVFSGSSARARSYQNLQDQLVLAKGAGRVRADLVYATGEGFEADRLAFELDRPERRYSAGALWAPGTDLTGRQKVLGLGVETQIDTRLDKDEILGSPLVLYLDHRARVDVMRDGRILSSALYEAGNQQIDTSNLPEGSYQVTLRVTEPGQQTREEPRFFTKSRGIPSLGRTDFFAFGGLRIAQDDPGSLSPSRHPYFQGGISRRMSSGLALEGLLETSERGVTAEIAATVLTLLAQVRAAGVADADGRYGAILQIGSSGTSRLNFNFDLRHIENAAASELTLADREPVATDVPSATLRPPSLSRRSYSAIGGIVSYSLANLRFLGIFSYRDAEAQAATYSLGPSLQWDVLRKGPFTLTLRGDVTATERGTSEFAGLSLRVLGRRASVTAMGGGRRSGIRDDVNGDGGVGSLAATWSANAAGGQLGLGAGYDHQPKQDDIVLSTQFDHAVGSLAGDFVSSEANGRAVSQYSLGLRTTIVAGGGSVRVAGKTSTESAIVAVVDGARPNDRFDVLVNEQVAGTVVGNIPLSLALPAYRAYSVRVRPAGKDMLSYDSSTRNVGLYPGAVTRLSWKSAPVTIKIGRLVSFDGEPLRNASITGSGVWSETDDNGLFQVEAADDAQLTVTTSQGATFTLTLPEGQRSGEIDQLGAIKCCGIGGLVSVSALEPRASATKELVQ